MCNRVISGLRPTHNWKDGICSPNWWQDSRHKTSHPRKNHLLCFLHSLGIIYNKKKTILLRTLSPAENAVQFPRLRERKSFQALISICFIIQPVVSIVIIIFLVCNFSAHCKQQQHEQKISTVSNANGYWRDAHWLIGTFCDPSASVWASCGDLGATAAPRNQIGATGRPFVVVPNAYQMQYKKSLYFSGSTNRYFILRCILLEYKIKYSCKI